MRFCNRSSIARRIVTRYAKTALSFAATVSFVAAVIWLN
jgi:transposase